MVGIKNAKCRKILANMKFNGFHFLHSKIHATTLSGNCVKIGINAFLIKLVSLQ